ncbi:ankyrin repeat-containing domain protein [Penicillium samsonianum]|uniref:ankyrin repeat-containing domain protein n=1 Tax=Penicillium samsonianum TaxID=1882272 RepID=UPI00254974DD|nr:ankyrin repeat-containing domain protein [Penicillium samsonianum]KAJ6125967.1 ankyrin repeat-containing domain protein [Penicillium samsonianum]
MSLQADTNSTFQGLPFVHFVVSKGYILLLEWYLPHVSNKEFTVGVHGRDCFGNTPLMFAVISGQEEIAKLLIQYGADIHAPHNQGETPFLKAIKQQHCNMVRIMEVVDIVNKNTNEERENTSCRQEWARLQLMTPDETGRTALLWATEALCESPNSYRTTTPLLIKGANQSK